MAERMFPILGSDTIKAVPWAVLALHESQAQRNHGQLLERLARRGGLGVDEACAIIDGVGWGKWRKDRSQAFWAARLMGLVHRHEQDNAA